MSGSKLIGPAHLGLEAPRLIVHFHKKVAKPYFLDKCESPFLGFLAQTS